MGLGDWIMATAQVRTLNERSGKRVAVVDRMGRMRWSEAFENNPRIAAPGTVSPADTVNVVRLVNAGGARPYIRLKTDRTWYWQTWDIQPGELYLTHDEYALGSVLASGAVVVEPNTKHDVSNKAWPFGRWQDLVYLLPDLHWIQIGAPNARRLAGVRFIPTTIRQAFGIIAAARLFVGTEGALHHAAAALGTRAVVLWSEFISPAYTGYVTQRNIRKTSAVCGSRYPCAACRASMDAIDVAEVAQAVKEELDK